MLIEKSRRIHNVLKLVRTAAVKQFPIQKKGQQPKLKDLLNKQNHRKKKTKLLQSRATQKIGLKI